MTLQDTERALRRLAEAMARVGNAWQKLHAAAQNPRLKQNLQLTSRMLRQMHAAAPRVQSSLQLTYWMLQQIEAAKRNPKHKKAKPWLALSNQTPREMEKLLPLAMILEGDLTAVPRPKGRQSGARVKPSSMVEQLAERIAQTGERPTTAARKLLEKRGFRGDLKNRADALVKALKRRDR